MTVGARTMECDVVVVGAGPGGSMAAKYAALGGLDVILVEKKAEIGSPLRCAEGVSKKWFSRIGIELDDSWICTQILGMRFVSSPGVSFTTDEKEEDGTGRGYVLERHLFDKALARQAADAGAKIMMRTACRDIIRKDGKLVGIKADMMGESIEIYAKCIVAADGFESQVARWAGLDTTLDIENFDSCIQYRMTGIDVDPNLCEFQIGSAAPGGYIWIFPKGKGIANVGIGVQGAKCENGTGPKDHLDKFIAGDPRLNKGQIIEIVGGGVSTSNSERSVADNLIVVGDAARFINPLTGGGVHEACVSGMFAGQVLTKCEGDYSESNLKEYERLWKEEVGERFARNRMIKEWYTEASDETLDKIIMALRTFEVKRLKMDEILRILKEKVPGILPKFEP